MNREIKFRAWDLSISQMFVPSMMNKEGDVRHTGIALKDSNYRKAGEEFETWLLNGIGFILMQYVGLKDKKGIEIYEGDILEYETWHGGIEHTMYEKDLEKTGKKANWMRKKVVLGHPNGHYILRNPDDISDMTYVGETLFNTQSSANSYEIVGNIYQTPNLLEI